MSRTDREFPTPLAAEPESEAGALLRKLSEPPPFTGARARRALDGVYDRLAVAPRRRWWPILLSAPALAAAMVLVVIALRARPTLAPPMQLAPDGPSAEAPRVVVLQGAVDAHNQRIVLSEGRVIVQTAGSLAVIEIPGATTGHVTVRARSIVEVHVLHSRVRVSAYQGSAALEWVDLGKREIAAGRTVSTDGETSAIEPARADEVSRILRDGPGAQPPQAIEAPVPPPVRVPAPPVHVRPVATVQAVHLSPPPAPSVEPQVLVAPPVAVVAPPPPLVAIAVVPPPPPVATAPAAPAAPIVPARSAPSALTLEALSLERAVRALRHDRDPAAALHAIDEHLAAHPHGLLRNEAELTRVDALLQLSRRAEALAGLEKLSLTGLPRSREFAVIRGELRAGAGRCKDAMRDFAKIADGSDELAERALAGRADCRARSGDDAGARQDLQTYLERFPQGRFAARARAALAK